MATTEPRNKCANSSTSTPAKIDRKKCAPMPARITFGDHANTELFERKTCGTPAATAVRRIDPKFPGSWISSSNRQLAMLCGAGLGGGARGTAATPAALTNRGTPPGRGAPGTTSGVARERLKKER